jgi:hypothetical protein
VEEAFSRMNGKMKNIIQRKYILFWVNTFEVGSKSDLSILKSKILLI